MNLNKLKGRMAECGLSQMELAKRIGISAQAINAKMNNRSQFTLDQLIEIVEILEIDDPKDIFFTPNVPKMQQNIPREKQSTA